MPGIAIELNGGKRECGKRDNIAERHEYDARHRENQDKPKPDEHVDRSGGDAVDAENEGNVRVSQPDAAERWRVSLKSALAARCLQVGIMTYFQLRVVSSCRKKTITACCFKLNKFGDNSAGAKAARARYRPVWEVLVNISRLYLLGGVMIASLLSAPATAADITVGLVTSMTGPNASIGIPYSKGVAAGVAFKDEVNGIKLKVIQLDDASDPSTGTRDARKLIEEDKVDVLMGRAIRRSRSRSMRWRTS